MKRLAPLVVLALWLSAPSARAFCEPSPAPDGGVTLEGEPLSESRVCRGSVCAGIVLENAMSGHGATCLYAGDASGRKLDIVEVGVDVGRAGVEVQPDGAITLVVLNSERVRRATFRLGADQKLHGTLPPLQSIGAKGPTLHPPSCVIGEYEDEPTTCTGRAPPAATLSSARALCGAPTVPTFGTCSAQGCIVVGHPSPGPEACVSWWPREGRPVKVPVPSWSGSITVALEGSRLRTVANLGCKNTYCLTDATADLSETPPRFVTPVPPGDLAADGEYDVLPYEGPLKVNGLADEPQWKGPAVRMETAAHVEAGQDAWHGPKDASAEWLVRTSGPDVLFLVRVRDDHVLAPREGTGDAVMLGQGRFIFALRPNGKVEVREKYGQGPVASTCAWALAPEGYRVECRMPHAAVFNSNPPTRWRALSPSIRDIDAEGGPEKQLVSFANGRVWRTFPPTWEDALSAIQDR